VKISRDFSSIVKIFHGAVKRGLRTSVGTENGRVIEFESRHPIENIVLQMGAFYTNFVLKGASPEAAQKLLAGRNAVVAADQSGFVVVADEEAEDQDEELLNDLAAFLSEELACVVMAVLNHDDSVFMYALYDRGKRKDSYNSSPSYFDDEGPSQPSGGDAAALCQAFGCAAKDEVTKVLTAPSGEDYVFENERHADLARLLGHPEWSVCFGFEQLANGEGPNGDDAIELLHTNKAEPTREDTPGFYKFVIPHPTPGEEPISKPIGWLPATWEQMRSVESDLSPRCRRATASIRKSIETLGFHLITFQKYVNILNPDFVDGAGAFYADDKRQVFAQIIYLIYSGASGEIESIVCSFRATFGNETLVCTNQKPSPLGNPPKFRVVFEDTRDPLLLFKRFMEEFRERGRSANEFPTVESMAGQFDLEADIALNERTRKGQYVLMNPFEVWRAKQAVARSVESRNLRA
jgi:hypothetical protein